MLTRITLITAAGLLTLAALSAPGIADASRRKATYDAAETAYFECLQDLPRAECVTILTPGD